MNLNIGIIGEPAFVREFGKKGTESDIIFYNTRHGENTASFIYPYRYPEKLASLLFALQLSDAVVVEIRELNAVLGEVIIAIDTANIKKGFIYLQNNIVPEQLKPLLKGTVMEGFEFTDLPPSTLIERMFNELSSTVHEEEDTLIPIDHFFKVKGIGAVVLGIVRRGRVKKYENLILYPNKKTVTVRSIQTHDKDVNLAERGERVGLALKGINVENLSRGQVIAQRETDIGVTEEPLLNLFLVSYWKKPVKTDMVVYLSSLMQMRSGRLLSVEEIGEKVNGKLLLRIRVKLDKPFVYHPEERIFVAHLEGGALRIMGSATIVEG